MRTSDDYQRVGLNDAIESFMNMVCLVKLFDLPNAKEKNTQLFSIFTEEEQRQKS